MPCCSTEPGLAPPVSFSCCCSWLLRFLQIDPSYAETQCDDNVQDKYDCQLYFLYSFSGHSRHHYSANDVVAEAAREGADCRGNFRSGVAEKDTSHESQGPRRPARGLVAHVWISGCDLRKIFWVWQV